MSLLAPTVYPSMIARACSALDELPLFRDMPDGYLRVVMRIIKKINLGKLTAPIVASRGTLAKEAGKSVETVHRVVKWMETRALIERDQKARPGLLGSSSPLVPTEKLLNALMLNDGTSEGKPPVPVQNLVTFPSRVVPVTKPIAPKSDFVTFDKIKIPTDLAWLVQDQGLRSTGVLQLMKLAKKAKQQLSDVVSTTRKYLETLEGRELYAYLRALLGKNKDYGHQAREIAKEETADQERIYLREKGEALVGRTFRSRDERVLVTVEESGMLIEVRDGRRAARPMCLSFLEAIEAGRLVPSRDRGL